MYIVLHVFFFILTPIVLYALYINHTPQPKKSNENNPTIIPPNNTNLCAPRAHASWALEPQGSGLFIMAGPLVPKSWGWICGKHTLPKTTLQGTNISHLGKRKIIFKMSFLRDMLVPWRIICNFHFDFWSNSSRPTIPGSCHSSVRSCLHCSQWRRECVTGFPRVLDGAGGWAWPLHPGRLTWTIIMEVWKIIFFSKWVICRFYVNLPG